MRYRSRVNGVNTPDHINTDSVRLTGIRDADHYMRTKGIGLMLMVAGATYFITMLIIGVATMNGYIGYAGAAVCTAIFTPAMYVRKRNQLRRRFREQTLDLSSWGIIRADDCMRVEMAWGDIARLQQHDSTIKTGGMGVAGEAVAAVANATKRDVSLAIVGRGRVSPVPGAPRGVLRGHDRMTGSNLRKGESTVRDTAVIFPAEYEDNWSQGVVGSWVRAYRPDLFA